SVRLLDATNRLDASGRAIVFAGTTFTAELLSMHARSETALHRWDLVGDDELGDALLAQPELTRHAVSVLDTHPHLGEAPGNRARQAGLTAPLVVRLRAEAEPDIEVLFDATGDSSSVRFVDVDGASDRDDAGTVIVSDAGTRLLALWGRRS